MRLTLTALESEPLASYLVALGVLRVLHEQCEPLIRGGWSPQGFVLETSLGREELIEFFLSRWEPSPIVSPWNGGSGFYAGDTMDGRDRITASADPRLARYGAVIAQVADWEELPPIGVAPTVLLRRGRELRTSLAGKKAEALATELQRAEESAAQLQELAPEFDLSSGTIASLQSMTKGLPPGTQGPARTLVEAMKKVRTSLKNAARGDAKLAIMRRCRNELPDASVAWVDAAVGIRDDGFAALPLLGSGGNEGRLEYSNQFMQVASRLVEQPAEGALRQALFGEGAVSLLSLPAGQFDPGSAGGFNQGFGVESKKAPVNPWRFVLTFEGALLWSGAVARRHHTDSDRMVVSPFTVHASAAGYGSAAGADAGAARAEVWMPVWSSPVGVPELRAFLAEGRASVGRRDRSQRRARTGLDFARAASTLGVARGIDSFTRFSLLKRRGDSYVALPAGRYRVGHRTAADLLRELDAPLVRVDTMLRRFPGDPPASLVRARRRIDEASFLVAERGEPETVLALLCAIGGLERLIARRDPGREPALAAPLGGLSESWIEAAGDGVELRLARAFHSMRSRDAGPFRVNLTFLDPHSPRRYSPRGPELAWLGRDLVERLGSVLARRMLHARGEDDGRNGLDPLSASRPLRVEDALALLWGDIDEGLLEELIFGLGWVELASGVRLPPLGTPSHPHGLLVPPSYAVLALLFAGGNVREVHLRPEPSLLPLLRSGRVRDAMRAALRRLRVSGLAPRLSPQSIREWSSGVDAARLTAALLVPLSFSETERLARRVLLDPEQRNDPTPKR